MEISINTNTREYREAKRIVYQYGFSLQEFLNQVVTDVTDEESSNNANILFYLEAHTKGREYDGAPACFLDYILLNLEASEREKALNNAYNYTSLIIERDKCEKQELLNNYDKRITNYENIVFKMLYDDYLDLALRCKTPAQLYADALQDLKSFCQ